MRIATYVGFALTLGTPSLAAWNARRAHRERIARDAYTTLLAVLTKLVDKTHLPSAKLGIHAYLVKGRWLWARQERIARVRLSSHPPPSTIVWMRGKRYVGYCWAHDLWANFQPAKIYGAPIASAADWEEMPANDRFGLSYDEHRRSLAYPLVRVYPIHATSGFPRRDRYVGCITLGTVDPDQVERLLADDVMNLLADAAAAIGSSVKQS